MKTRVQKSPTFDLTGLTAEQISYLYGLVAAVSPENDAKLGMEESAQELVDHLWDLVFTYDIPDISDRFEVTVTKKS